MYSAWKEYFCHVYKDLLLVAYGRVSVSVFFNRNRHHNVKKRMPSKTDKKSAGYRSGKPK